MRASYVHTRTYTHSHVAKNDGVGGDVNVLERINIAAVLSENESRQNVSIIRIQRKSLIN